MPTLDEYMAMLTPQQPSQQQRIMQALGQLGVGLLSAPTWQKGLARGGLLAYDAQQQSADRAAQDQIAKLRTMQMAQDMADKDASRAQGAEDAKQLGAIFSGAPNLPAMGPGGPTPANAAAVKPPSQVEQYRKAAAFMAARGNVEGAKKLSDIADQMEGTFSTTPQVTIGPDGKPVYAQFNNKGGFRTADGVAPPPELQMLPLGDRTVAVDKLTTKPGAEFAMGQSPESKASNALGWANYGLSKDRFAYDQQKDAADRANVSATGGKPSDAQLMSRGFLYRMQQSGNILNKIEDTGYTPGFGEAYRKGMSDVPVVGGVAQMIGGHVQNLVSPEAGQYRQAQEDWVRAKLRKESGAVIGPKEMEDEIKTYFPQTGDSKATIQQKREARMRAEQAMAIQGGLEKFDGAPDPLGIRGGRK